MPNTKVAFEYDGTVVRILPVARTRKPNRSEALVAHLRRHAYLVVTPPEAPARDHKPAPEP